MMIAIQLKSSVVDRAGVTARYWVEATRNISCVAGDDLKLRFSIASKGGGKTDIQVSVSPEDIRSIILSSAKSLPGLAKCLTEAAHIAVLRALSDSRDSLD